MFGQAIARNVCVNEEKCLSADRVGLQAVRWIETKYYFYDYNDRRGLIHSSMFRREREVIRIFGGLLMLHSSTAFSDRGHPPCYPEY